MAVGTPTGVSLSAVTSPSGVRTVAAHPFFIPGTLSALNDSTLDTWPPGSVIVTGINPPTWRAGILATGDDPGSVYLPGEMCVIPTSYDLGHTFLGVTLNYAEPGTWCVLAGYGSIVPVRCRNAATDTGLQSPGTWLRWSADLGADGLPGNVESVTVVDLVSANDAVSMPGSIVGQIVVPAGTSASGNTGSNYYVIARINPR